MDFIQTSNKQVDKFGPGKHGFSAGNPAGGVQATYFSPEWADGVQQELINIVEGAGVVPTAAVLTQVRQAIKRLAGGNVTTVNFAGSPFALTADHAGLVLVDATAGNVVINLPAANVLAGLPYEFRRVDVADANSVTVNRAGADTFDAGDTTVVLLRQIAQKIRSNGVDKWLTTTPVAASQSEVDLGSEDSRFVTSKKLRTNFASNAEAQALSSVSKIISPATLAQAFKGSNQSLATTGYQKLPGGLILQWGSSTSAIAANGNRSVTFPIAFPTALFAVVLGGRTIADTSINGLGYRAESTTGMVLTAGGYQVEGFGWLALGN